MGIYLNPGLSSFKEDRNTRYYIDKSMLISLLNGRIERSSSKYICVSRPRRFGKSMAADMIAAYYSKGVDSHDAFSGLKIASDPSFEENINRYNVIKLDMNNAVNMKGERSIAEYIDGKVLPELRTGFPDVPIPEGSRLPDAIQAIYSHTGERFVFIIDEYDIVIRDPRFRDDLEGYLGLLVSLFKGAEVNVAIALAYLTGIMPIVKDVVQSKLNNFTEYTMLDAMDMAPFMGFTTEEVEGLCKEHGFPFEEMRRWYDGYSLNGIDLYSPRSVISALERKRCDCYWTATSSYEVISTYIAMDFDGIRESVVSMIGGGEEEVNTRKFNNTLTSFRSKDDIFTYLSHLGYLAYDMDSKTCRIPNREVLSEWVNAIEDDRDYSRVAEVVKGSRRLLEATWEMDEEAVASSIARTHMEVTSNLTYNNEGSFQSAIRLAYFYADMYYTVVSELPAGKGYADVAFIPYVPSVPAMVVELKRNSAAGTAIGQIRERRYPEGLEKYRGSMLLVGIGYDERTKEHWCRIERA
ncbi:MAG: AAA family ATPase [Candidatus Ornithospirochaeta sp.]|nr:AAA family ATPase [Candidatus Ornithospirochaeta sp.]